MSCMGPSKESAYKEGEAFKEEVMQLLKDKFNIRKEGIIANNHKWDWQMQEEKLKEALQELFWIDAADGF